jgi:hypothetical protein
MGRGIFSVLKTILKGLGHDRFQKLILAEEGSGSFKIFQRLLQTLFKKK